jgi:hypothetical protein
VASLQDDLVAAYPALGGKVFLDERSLRGGCDATKEIYESLRDASAGNDLTLDLAAAACKEWGMLSLQVVGQMAPLVRVLHSVQEPAWAMCRLHNNASNLHVCADWTRCGSCAAVRLTSLQ